MHDPTTGKFSLTGSLNIPRDLHTASLLANGQVLIAGGEDVGNFRGSLTNARDITTAAIKTSAGDIFQSDTASRPDVFAWLRDAPQKLRIALKTIVESVGFVFQTYWGARRLPLAGDAFHIYTTAAMSVWRKSLPLNNKGSWETFASA